MPYIPHDDRDLHRMALLPVPDAIRMLEKIPCETERRRLAGCLARLWRGVLNDVNGAHHRINTSVLDDESKQILARGLID